MKSILSSMNRYLRILAVIILSIACFGCKGVTVSDKKIRVLATTSIIADVVRQVVGDQVDISILIPIGADPHEFSARPKDAVEIESADIIFANGAGLEEFLLPLIESLGGNDKWVEVSAGIKLLTLPESGSSGILYDPHTWMDPKNILIWLNNITDSLEKLDPTNKDYYRANAELYRGKIQQLDTWIHSEIQVIPQIRRVIITDHDVLGYFISVYDFQQIATISTSFSTDAAPSAQVLADIENLIAQNHIPAIFITESSSQILANQIANDTGIEVVTLLHASLTAEDGPAPSYLEFMRYNVAAIVRALK